LGPLASSLLTACAGRVLPAASRPCCKHLQTSSLDLRVSPVHTDVEEVEVWK
jgi:hypothetical protein